MGTGCAEAALTWRGGLRFAAVTVAALRNMVNLGSNQPLLIHGRLRAIEAMARSIPPQVRAALRQLSAFGRGRVRALPDVANRNQVVCASYLVLLVVAAVLAAAIPAASNFGNRCIHALIAVCVVGVAALAILFPAMFVLAWRDARTARRARLR